MKCAYLTAFTSLLLAGSAQATPKDYDGAWHANVACGPSLNKEASYSYERRVNIVDGAFAFTRERLLWSNHFNTTVYYTDDFTGRILNGFMTVNGKGSASQLDIPRWRYEFSGQATDNQSFSLQGRQMQETAGIRTGTQLRSCTFSMKLAQVAPTSPVATDAPRAIAPLDNETIRQIQTALQALGLYGGTVDGIWGRGTEAAVKEWQRRSGFTSPFDAAQVAMLIRPQQPDNSSPPSRTLSEQERQLAQRERELAERERRLEAVKANQLAEAQAAQARADAERARQLADRQRQIDAKEQQIASQERAAGVANANTRTQTASPFIGSWCSTGPGGSLTKMDVHAVEGQTMTGRYMYNGLPTQVDDAMSGTVVDGVLRARIGNVSWTLTAKGAALDGNVSNHRTGTTVYLQLKRC